MTIDRTLDTGETVDAPPSFGATLANERGRGLIARVAALAKEKLAPRAAHYDRITTTDMTTKATKGSKKGTQKVLRGSS